MDYAHFMHAINFDVYLDLYFNSMLDNISGQFVTLACFHRITESLKLNIIYTTYLC